jgi:hypothetical protein
VDPWGLIWVTTGTSFSNYTWSNWFTWLFNGIIQELGRGMDPNMPGSDPAQYIGLRRDVNQEWQPDPANPCRDKEFPLGTQRSIPQTYQQYPYGYSEPSIVDPSSPTAEGYGWYPLVPTGTYNNYPGTTYYNYYYWTQGK